MKLWILSFFLFILFCSVTALAETEENIYLYDSLEIELDLEGSFSFTPLADSSFVEEASAELYLLPENSLQQSRESFSSQGIIQGPKVFFEWSEEELESFNEQSFSYNTVVQTNNIRNEISEKIPFPIQDIEQYIQDEPDLHLYLEETENIDFSNQNVIAQANELAQGKDDLYEVVFSLASWVDQNIDYDLNTLTAKSSQSSSWVLQNKEGVCDEMTSLFIAMSRSLGIPARFVTGVSYTNSELFTEPWQAHGWAEVYFPEYGWVSFDPTFGEFGYVDVTHIKLKESVDATSASTFYEWKAREVDLETEELDFTVQIKSFGQQARDQVSLESETSAELVDFGSFNLIKATVNNVEDYYVASAVSLAVPPEIEILDEKRQSILLSPSEQREIYWVVHVQEELNDNYIYDFPYLIYNEKNTTTYGNFQAQEGSLSYSFDEIKTLLPEEEETTYTRQVSFDCDYPEIVAVEEKTALSCTLKNKGNAQLNNLQFCVDSSCQALSLPINQEFLLEEEGTFDEVGWQSVLVKAENEEFKKSEFINIKVLDEANINIESETSKDIYYKDPFFINFKVESSSFSTPKDLELVLESKFARNTWTISSLEEAEEIILELDSAGLAQENKFTLTGTWTDELGREYSLEEEIPVTVQARNFGDKVNLFLNRFI